jgi:hypothetical protein
MNGWLWHENFPYVSRAALAGHIAGRPRVAASLPARPGGDHRQAGGQAEARDRPRSDARGLKVDGVG